jgi:hypothetical protein
MDLVLFLLSKKLTQHYFPLATITGFTVTGEPLPPLYIISSSTQDEANFHLDPSIYEGLPTIMAKYDRDTYNEHYSFIVVCHTGPRTHHYGMI